MGMVRDKDYETCVHEVASRADDFYACVPDAGERSLDVHTIAELARQSCKRVYECESAEHAIDADLYLYDNLFTLENVNDVPEGTDYLDYLNPDSLKKLTGCKLEPSLADAKEGERFQFVRMGYYCKDRESGRFNRIVTLKDSFSKTLKK